jgi:uncharacterized integral membrane protein (TIGR00698 family)
MTGGALRMTGPAMPLIARIAIPLGFVVALAGLVSAPLALALGMAVGLLLGNPWSVQTGRASRLLLQTAVVGLGFGLGLRELASTGATGLLLTAVVVAAVLASGLALGRLLRVPGNASRLVAVGTAICGGSAIAAIAPLLRARDEEVGAALATVFLLNAAGLFLFPHAGAWLGLEPVEFGYWAALAIHDTSSVVAAGAVYGGGALAVATTVKLTRTAWLVPLVLLVSARAGTEGRARLPWFIFGFVAAAVLRAAVPAAEPLWNGVAAAARHLLVPTLFLIGTGMTRQLLLRLGARPLLHGVALWLLAAAGSLALVRAVSLPL